MTKLTNLLCPEVIKDATDTLSEAPIRKLMPTSTLPEAKAQPEMKCKSRAGLKKSGIAALRKKQQAKVRENQTKKNVFKPDSRRKFQCALCKATFDKNVSLGGHYSKAHPGQSQRYNAKLATRASREDDRKYLKLAKEWFA